MRDIRNRLHRLEQLNAANNILARRNPAILANANPYWKQLTWFIDPANVTGKANDTNSGLTRTAPLVSYNEIVRRWGTVAPQIVGTMTITWLSSCSIAQLLSDPVFFDGTSYNGQIFFTGDLTTPLISGATLSGVVAYASPNQRWNCKISGLVPGPTTLDLLVHDRNNNGWFITRSDAGGGAFEITEPGSYDPAQAYSQPTRYFGGVIADGHVVDVCALPRVNISIFRPVQLVDDYNGGAPQLIALTVTGPYLNDALTGYGETYMGGPAYCSANRCVFYSSVGACGGSAINLSNAVLRQGLYSTAGGTVNLSCCGLEVYLALESTTTLLVDGFTLVDNITIAQLDRAMIRMGRANWRGAISTTPAQNQGYGFGWSDGRISVGNGFQFIGDPAIPPGVLDGSVTIDLHAQIALVYNGTAVSCFPGVTGFTLDGAATASSFDGAVWHGGITITAAHLDAAAGVAGFGGYAYGIRGSSISQYS